MTKKEINNPANSLDNSYHKLSIQVSLNGLSFCVFDTIGSSIPVSRHLDFGKELSPYEVQKELKALIKSSNIEAYNYSEVVVIHRNNLFGLVPKALFNKDELPNYLKFNTKILANDLIAFDEIESYDMINVYVPFVNINNFIYDLFGEFEFKHNGTVLIEALLNTHSNGKEPICYVHVSEQQMDITVLSQKRLLFYNSFQFITKEDFIYYLLFALEQLKLDTTTVKLRLFGAIEESDEIYGICYEYIQHLSIFIPPKTDYPVEGMENEAIDFTVMNAL